MWPRGLIQLDARRETAPGPSAIVWPSSVEDVVGLVRLARSAGLSLVPFGAGSGVCGAVLPTAESVVVDLKRFSELRIGDGPELDVGAGLLGLPLEETLLAAGYTAGHYPSSIMISTVGGWVAARGAGQCSGRYGKVEDMVTRLDVVLGSGEVLRAHSRQGAAELVPLLIGSEGTLAIVTRVGLRLHAAPSARAFAAFAFENVEAGVQALRALFQSGLRPAVARLYDPLDTFMMADTEKPHEPPAHPPGPPASAALRAVVRAPTRTARAMLAVEKLLYSRAALVLVHEGDAASVADEAAAAARLCQAHRSVPLGEGPARAWYKHRYHVSYRQAPLFRGGVFVDTMEVAAPWSRLMGVYDAVRAALSQHALVMAHFSHSYPDGGSIYFTMAADLRGKGDPVALYDRAWRVGLAAAIDAGATLTHHHGVGRSKAPRLGEELGAAVRVVRELKAAWDPDGILNPGALLPPESEAEKRDSPEPPADFELDRQSALCRVPGAMTLGAVEQYLRRQGHHLGLVSPEVNALAALSVDAWIGLGMPGSSDRYADPAGVRLNGISAILANGRRFALHTAPRRATGPDLTALFVGLRGRFGRIESATLPAPGIDARPPVPMPFEGERNPPLEASETAALDALGAVLLAPG
jgi:alkyldihydroxyacetonephosphate synthase